MSLKKKNSGFIALMSAVILSAVLLLLAANLSFTGFFDRSNILDSELKKRSLAAAEACADTAILKLINDKDYILVAADHTISVGTDSCDIYSLSPAPVRTGNITITTKAKFNDIYFTTLRIVVDSTNNMSVQSWEEI